MKAIRRERIVDFKHLHLKGMVWAVTLLLTTGIYANPQLNNIASGQVSIQQTSNTTVINQTSENAIINWQNFNIGQQESTHFQQPAGGITLNRISPNQGPSDIYGQLTATGQIILVNPAGIFFGPNAYVNVGGMIASTANLSDHEFLNGYYHFSTTSPYPASITNQGQLIAANHGLIALIGGNVQNNGLIQANLGHIVLASGSTFTMNFAGNQLLNFSVGKKSRTTQTGITNTGTLLADGGTILVTAKTAAGVLDNVIDMQGIAQARSVSEQNGVIIISGNKHQGIVNINGTLDVSGLQSGETGGDITVTGYNLLIGSSSLLNASGDDGGGNILIGGNAHGIGPLPSANATVLMPNATILADAITNGNGGNIVLWSDSVTKAYGNLSAQGGASDGTHPLISA